MPIPTDLALFLLTGIIFGLGLSMLISQAIGGRLANLTLTRRAHPHH